MLALEMYVNGWKICTAGIEQGCVCGNVMVGRGPMAREFESTGVGGIAVVSGSSASKHAKWPIATVSIGDEVRFRVVETERPDNPETGDI